MVYGRNSLQIAQYKELAVDVSPRGTQGNSGVAVSLLVLLNLQIRLFYSSGITRLIFSVALSRLSGHLVNRADFSGERAGRRQGKTSDAAFRVVECACPIRQPE